MSDDDDDFEGDWEDDAIEDEGEDAVRIRPRPVGGSASYRDDGALVIDAASLAWALEIALSVIQKHNTIPIISMVRVAASEAFGFVRFAATDLDIEIEASVQTSLGGSPPPPFCFLPRPLLGVLDEIDPQALVILRGPGSAGSDHGQVEWPGGRAMLPARSADDYPPLRTGETIATRALPADFAEKLDRVSFAISTEETRYYLNGVAIYPQGGENHLVATDGHRLAAVPAGLEPFERTIIVPAKTVKLWCALFGGEAALSLHEKSEHISLACEGLTLASKLIDGTYPDWPKIVPKPGGCTLKLNRARLFDAVRTILPLAPDYNKALSIAFAEGRATLKTAPAELGEAEVEVGPAEGDFPRQTGVNGGYLAEALENVSGEYVTLRQHIEGDPIAIDGDCEGEFFVIVPLRV